MTGRDRLAVLLQTVLPTNVQVVNLPSGLAVFRPEKVRPILDADPAFYRPGGEDDLAAIERVCATGDNGELLGYGTRNWFVAQGARVSISGPDGIIFMFFVSEPARAEHFARERLKDIATYTDQRLRYVIE